ncbi:portal protein [Cupriavidus alkaliphilus]|uniref:Protein-disulfide isomerase-like protein with CxxC motif n=1 Tax=Cupriavidus alkaliphilus TaxID=942866 RepID=A0A7W4VFF9_9BURK|nr:phage portal protein [Cupriavidus alkaliphilus]MBB3010638.1 protein-disulfide isomerase-like protein with CxxC motif [Cupriavidus alkaliphilus]
MGDTEPYSAGPSTDAATTAGADAGRVDGDIERSNETPEELANKPLLPRQVAEFLEELRHQPPWRKEADRCADYYDGNQLDARLRQILEERGQPPLITNLIKSAIDTVLGMEAKTRSDWRVRAEDDGIVSSDASEALSVKLKHAESETRADRACSDAYAGQVKAGLGWVEVSREGDPFKGQYRVKPVHRREIHWDWRSQEPDLSDAKYLIRRRWLDEDAAIARFPEYANLLRHTCGGWAGFDPIRDQDTGLARSFDIERDSNIDADEFRDIYRKRVCLYEIWYRKWVSGFVMLLPDGRAREVDFDNPKHTTAILAGLVKVERRTFEKVRLAWYCGPHFLYDVPSPYKHGNFPYVPFFGHREDLTGAPYGLIRSMLSPQDEVNARKSKQLWLLNSRQVITDDDAVVDHDEVREEVARPNAYIRLRPNRSPTSRFEVKHGGDLAAQQHAAMQDAKQEIAEASGIHKTMMGQQSGATSGLAINSLVEQGLNTLAEINDNYRFARRMVGEMLFSLMLEDMAGRQIPVELGEGKRKRTVVLNQVVQGEDGQPVKVNDTSRVRAKIVLDDIPSTPTFRLQQLQMLSEVAKALPKEQQAVLVPFLVEMSDMPNKSDVVDQLREMMGLGDEEAKAQAQQAQATQAEQLAKMQQRLQVMEAALTAAKVRKENAAADKLQAETAQIGMMPAEYTQFATEPQ